MRYSQNDEEAAILQALNDPSTRRRFLDVGAFDPFKYSNTRALVEYGWGGVMIEPAPVPFAALLEEYGRHEKINLVLAALVTWPETEQRKSRLLEMFANDDAYTTSTLLNYEKWKRTVEFRGKFDVGVVTWEEIYARYGPFSFVSIDTEGTSGALLLDLLAIYTLSMSATLTLPEVICVEYDQELDAIRKAATLAGYREVYLSPENVVLVKK
ncbi:MAG: hypothetical protein GY906_22665 [bacterium]|nr:hypothetical protein [bacterium]